MPFPDEPFADHVAVVDADPRWPVEFEGLASRLSAVLGRLAVQVDHIGSTAVPGLPAKDCIDVQVRAVALGDPGVVGALEGLGFRRRPESWNQVEIDRGQRWPKMVFAPPVGERSSNIHVREAFGATARRNLLFRDFLRVDASARLAWGEFKRRLAEVAPDISRYGQIKQPATEVLMIAAEKWAQQTAWMPPS